MQKVLLGVVFAIVLAAIWVGAAAQQAPAPAKVRLAPCDIAGVPDKAQCGSYDVWENRDAKAGRRIGLNIVVLPATGQRASDAVTFLAGGPGDAATRLAPFLSDQFAAVRKNHDILLVDQRGTGKSHALDCDLYPGNDAQTALGPFYPVDRVKTCRAALEKKADVRYYTTSIFVDDLDEVRAALGYDSLNLFGGSYGTRAALEYLRRHSNTARSAVLQGVSPASDLIPLAFPQYAQHAIENVFADCAADAACHSAFPNLPSELKSIVERAKASPVPVDILDPRTGDSVHVSLSRDLLGESLRYLMYQSASALLLPDMVHQAAGGDFGPLAEFALFSRRQLVNGLGQGLYLSTTCSEDLPFVDPAKAEQAAANTFLGDYRYKQQRAACDAWVRGPIPSNFHEPVRSDVPVLLLSGSWDPVTPPSNAEQAAKTLTRATHLVVHSGGHDYDGLQGIECVGKLINDFMAQGNAQGIDANCVNRIRRPPFPTAPLETKSVKLSGAELNALAGKYSAQGAPDLQIKLANGKLTALVEGEEPLALVPVSPTRLRLLGAIGSYLDVEMENGKPGRITLNRTGAKVLTWTRNEK